MASRWPWPMKYAGRRLSVCGQVHTDGVGYQEKDELQPALGPATDVELFAAAPALDAARGQSLMLTAKNSRAIAGGEHERVATSINRLWTSGMAKTKTIAAATNTPKKVIIDVDAM